MSIVGTISAENGILTSTLTDSDILNPTRTGSYSDDYLIEDIIIGQTVTIELTSTEIDTYLQLIDADTGEVITEDDDSSTGVNSRFRFTALEGVNYIVRVSSYSSRAVGTYQLIAQSDAPPQIAGTISAANGIVAGSLTTEDSLNPTKYQNYFIDDYQLTDVTAGEVVTLNLNSADFNTYIQLINADTGAEIKSKQGTNSELRFVAVTGVNYLVRVSSSSEETIGTYQLNANSAVTDMADLTITDVTAPATITLGESVEVSWTVANLGNADTTPNSWYEQVYLSRDTTFNPNEDASLGYVYNNGSIAVSETLSFSSNINISSFDLNIVNEASSNNPLEGDWYLLFVADYSDDQLESNEANNIAVHQIQLNATDLAITNVEAPASVSVNDSTSVSWTVENIGDVSAFGYWSSNVYLSDDEYFDLGEGGDIYLGYGEREDSYLPLLKGDSYTISADFTVENIGIGSRYLLFVADTYNDLGETDETNNVIVVPIEINGVDANLSINATAPTTATLGESIAVSWTVNNTGSQSAKAYWQDIIYLSDDEYFDSSDIYVGGQYRENSPLGSQSNYTVNRNITIPNSAQAGSRYLLFVADQYNNQYETNETDNVYAAPIEILAPDLTIEATAPNKSNANTRISGSWTVKNTGSIETNVSYWYDQVYFSTDDTYDSSDTQLTFYYISGSPSPLAAGDTYTKNYNLTVPDVEAGNYYLLFHTDQSNRQGETDETDNISAVPIEITQSPNLTITDVNVPNNGYIGNSINASWTVNNSGEGTALREYWYDYIYLSTDENYDSGDTLLTYYYTGSSTPLAAGDSYTANSNLVIPDVEAGNYYLLFYTDKNQTQGESNETDNITAVPIELFPSNTDLAVNNITAPDTANAGNRIALSSTVINNGLTSISGRYWYDQVYFSTDETYDSTDTLLTESYIGGSTASLAPGATYSKNLNFTLPDVEVGNYYLIFSTDGSDYLTESDETNNISTIPIEIAESPNLTVSDVVVPERANASDQINVSWTVKNTGSGEALSSYWYDRVYFSTDEIYDENDIQLAYNYKYSQTSLAPEESYTSSRNITLPNRELGNYYLLFYTDDNQTQGESDETDNVRAVPIELTSTNLIVSNTSSPAEAVVNDTINVSWTVTNEGNGQTSAYQWYDYVYLSSDANYDENDTQLISKVTEGAYPNIEPGNSYTSNSNIYIPNKEAGDYYLIFYTNNNSYYYSRQNESDRSDNFTAVPISLSVPDVDLSITVNSSSTEALVQGGVNLSWTVTNNGTDVAKAKWYDYIYVSDDQVYDSSDRYVDSIYNGENTPLAPGQSYTKSKSVTIPNTKSGDRYLLFVADAYNNLQGESNDNNNTVAVPINLKAPNLTISDVIAPSKANKSSSGIGVSWKVTNTGDVTTLAQYWNDTVYFSTDATYDSSDIRLADVRKENTYTYSGYYNSQIRAGQSYTRTSNITIPNADPGNYYLLFITDSYNNQGETNGADNTQAIPFEVLNKTNIKTTSATAPLQATLNDTIDVSWTVTNTGLATASATWYDYIYLSEDENLDSSDIYVKNQKQENNTFLATGESYTATSNITIPKAAGTGDRYLLFVADRSNNFSETDETDNVFSVPIELNATNLKVTGADTPSTVSFNETLNVSWTVANTGENRASANWYDYIYLSNDAVYDSSDTYLNNLELGDYTPLEAGDAYTVSQSITIPRTVNSGNQYILFVTDRNNYQGETDETDNTLAVPIEVKSPDLEFAEVIVPANASLNQTFNLSWTVTNTGEGTAFPDYYSNWRDYVYLSDDAIYDETDISLTNRAIINSLESGNSYTFNADVRLSDDRVGSHYILFVLDKQNIEKESNETNNVYAAPINIQTANLEISEVSSPAQVFLNQPISLSWTVTNTGVGDAFAPRYKNYSYSNPWTDLVYLSEDEVIDENDRILTNYGEYKYSLASEDSYTISRNVNIPSTAAGDYYLLFATDAGKVLVESDENDNVYVKPITIGATNIEVTAVNAPTDLILNQTISASWTVSNTGNVTAPTDWYDYVYISDDQYLDNSDVFLSYQWTYDRTPLAGGDSYTVNKDLIIPHTATGDRYLLFVADGNNAQGETNENDNIYALPVNIAAPNLTITDTKAPQSSYLGETVGISWTVANQGAVSAPKSGYDYVYISDDQYLDDSDVNLIAQTTGDYTSLSPDDSYTISRDVIIPRTLIGDKPDGIASQRYLLFVADRNNRQGETNENDNLVAVPIKLTALDVDLVVSDISAPIESYAGEEVEVVWTVTNNGSDDATGTWTDRIYLASDPANIKANEVYGSFEFTGTVAAGESIERRQKITLPQTVEGDFKLVVKTDIYDSLIEYGREGNNTTVREEQFTSILPTFPNLQVTNVTAPITAFSSQKTVVKWTVSNTGNGATSAPRWQDSVWLSFDRNFDGADILLGQVANTSYLNAGESYSNSIDVTLPQGIDGNYYFLVQTDWGKNQVFEFQNENDNLGVSNVSDIELTPPPDLQVSVNALSNAFSGQFTSLSWTVTNEGQGRTLQSSWYDEVYLSTDKVLDSSDQSLGRQNHSGILQPGESYTVSNTTRVFELPEGISGDYYFIVRTDAGGQVYESALSANNIGFEETPTTVFLTPPPDLEISVDVSDTALASHNLTIDYSVSNYGATATTNGKWIDTFYLSVDDQFDASDIVLGSRTNYGSLDIGELRDNSINLTLPDGISGNYYLFAKTDSNDDVFELDNDNNIAFETITIESKPADLAVSEVIIPSIIEAGTGTQISWTVTNQGTGDTVKTRWNDQLWLSNDSVIGNGDDRLLETFTHNGLLNAGESYTNDELVTIPFNLQGNYQLYIKTDVNNSVYEAEQEANNTFVFSPIAITRETPDLQVTTVNAPVAGSSGESITVEWSVANSGIGKTNSNYWYDEVFLSLDRDLGDSSDISLGKVYHSGSLNRNETYNASHTFNLPQNLNGEYYVVVRTDTNYYTGNYSGDRVLEAFENNNELATSSKTSITLNTLPDLVIKQIDAPLQAISGQTFDLSWTVSNQGSDANNNWRDVFYLSRDRVFDRSSDIYLGSSFHYGNLAAGGEYSKTASFDIPRGLSGPFYVFGVTDSGDDVYERDGENNNIAFDGNSLNVILPPPADLGDGSINIVSNAATSGDFISLDYTVQSLGANLPLGTWTDSIYLSTDEQWDINDLLLTKVKTSDFSIIDGGYTRNVYTQLPGVVPGDYHLIVRSDILNEIPESNEDNNITVSAETINIDIPSLLIDTSVSGTLTQGQEAYYRVDVPSGETLQFVLNSLSNNAVNELYVSYGKMPTRADFDFGFEEIAADQDLVVPLSEAGTYYILARGQYVPGVTQDYSLAVNTIDFGITDIETTVGDKGGTITFAIEGAKFNSNLTAALENEAGEIIESTNIWYEDSTKVFATFDLSNATIGNYNLKVSQSSINADFVENEAGEIIPVLRETTLESILEDGFEVVAAREDDLLVTVTSTSRVGAGQYFDIVLSYANNGTHDIEAPLLHLEANQNIGFINIQDGDEFVGNNSMTLLGISNEGAAGILRPGEIGTIRLRGRAGGEGTINISASQVEDDGTSLDYEKFINYLGGDLADPAWANAADALKEKFGTSWSSFASGLAALATERSTLGEYSHSISKLWTDVALDAWSDGVDSNDISEVETISNLASSSLFPENLEDISNTLEVQSQSENFSNARLASSTIDNSILKEFSYSVSEFPGGVASDARGEESANNTSSFVNEQTIALTPETLGEKQSFNTQLSTELADEKLSIDNFFTIESSIDLELRKAEETILKGAALMRSKFGAVYAAEALEKFVNELGIEQPPEFTNENEYKSDLGNYLTLSNGSIDSFLTKRYSDESQGKVETQWSKQEASITTVKGSIPYDPVTGDTDGPTVVTTQTSLYPHTTLYENTHHDTSIYSISEAVKRSGEYFRKVRNNDVLNDLLEQQIENLYDNGELNSSNQEQVLSNPLYIGDKGIYEANGEEANLLAPTKNNSSVIGAFDYFDQKKLLSPLKYVAAGYVLMKTPVGRPFGELLVQKGLNEMFQYYNQYFGTVQSSDLALLIGRTGDNTQWVRVNSIELEEFDKCSSARIPYKANINFYLYDGTTFDADDAYKDESLEIINVLNIPSLITPLITIGQALGLGWDVQQFGYGQPHFNLVEVEDTLYGFIDNPDYNPNCEEEDVPSNPPTSPPLGNTTTGVFVSRDPNDILGPEGFGEEKWIDANEPLDYTIRFENDPKLASAPAQVVRITQQLDSDLDFRTFRVGDFGFGDTFIDVPDNRAFYQTRLDLVAERGIYVDVFAGIDIATGEAFWELRSIDPATGEQPSDPLLGFLPPNLTKPEGDGFVSYSIRTDRDIETGAVIDAEATIVFDINEPIDTPAIFNTIDVGKPTSTVNALPETSDSEEFTVSWSGNDDANGSAIADYTIYVSENGGEYTPWLANTTLTEATFTGTPGSSYEFLAVARDNAGNIQDIPTTAQAVISIAGGNNPPVLVNSIGTQIAAEDSNFSYSLTEDIFIDNDEGEVLTYTATLSNGSDLPTWLTFDVETRTFSGTPTNENIGNLNILVTVTDNDGETVSDTFELIVENVNDAPTLEIEIPARTATEDLPFSFTLPADTFNDVDAEDSLIYTATLADGNELPNWLTFNAETKTFNGTPVNENVGTLSLRVTATDNSGESVNNIFELEVANVNDAPTVKSALANQVATEDESFSFTFAANTFNDVDTGDSLTYTATLADGSELPSWLAFNAETRTFSGTPTNANVGNLNLRVTATDHDGESASDTFNLEVVNVNDPPTVKSALANQVATEEEEFNFTLAEDTFNDVDSGDSLTYTATNADGSDLPTWLTFNAETRTFSGTPVNEDVGNLSVRVTATDNDGESASTTFDLEVVNVNDTPILNTALANQVATEDEAFSFTFNEDAFNDVDAGDSLTYSATNADGSELPSWLTFDAETRTFNGTPINENVGNQTIKVTASDNDGETASDTFELEVANVNDAPTVKSALTNQTATEDIEFSFTFAETTFKDVDTGDSLTYAATLIDGSALPDWLTFNPARRTFSGTPVNEDVGTLSIQVTATDNDGEVVSDTFELEVVNVNDAPILENAIANQIAIEDEAFSFTFNETTFKDVDAGDVLTYTASLSNGSELPIWLSFDAETRTFSGIPVNENVSTLSVLVTATDNNGESVEDTFELEVINVNDTPTVKTALANQVAIEDAEFSFTWTVDTFNDVDAGDSLTYSATNADGSELPNWLTFNPETRTFNGIPVNKDVGNLSIIVTATDQSGETISNAFELMVINVNDVPILENALANQTATEDEAFSLTFPANTFNDVDAGDSLTYTVADVDGNELPSWLTFDAETRTLIGTPVNEDVGNLSIQVTATDHDGEIATDIFELEVINVNDTPLDINLSNLYIDENSSNGTIIGSLSTLDPDLGDSFSYTLLNNADGRFILNNNNLQVAAGNLLDFETNSSHQIEIQTTDTQGLSITKNFTLLLNDLNEAPITINDRVTANSSNAKIISIESLLSNDRDPEGNPLSLVSIGKATGGTISLDGDSIIFTPNSTSNIGNFEYSVSDGVFTSTATVAIDVGGTQIGGKRSDTLNGTPGDDLIYGDSGNDTLNGGSGNDTLDGGKDNDLLLGGEGTDYLIGNSGLDTLDGGNGGDIYFADHNELDIYSDTGNYGIDVIKATGRKDFDLQLGLTFNQDNGIEQIDGTAISKKFEILDGGKNDNVWDFSDVELLDVDLIDGKKGNDLIIGSAGSDLIYGDSGNDTLNGGLGNDILDGGKDNDYLYGGSGDDILTGGKGKDSFVFNSPNEGIDTITDFSVKDDTLVFSAAGFGRNLTAGMVSSEMFTISTTATSNEHRFIYDVSSGDVFYDSDGTGDQERIKIAQLDSGLNLGSDNLFVGL